MAKAPEGVASEPLSAGWARLADGEWAAVPIEEDLSRWFGMFDAPL